MSRLRKRVVPFRWSTITASFVQGTASTISLSTFLTNTNGLAITYAVGTGSLPSGVTLSTAGVLSYNGTGAVASSTVQFRASSGVHVADSDSTSVGIAAYVPTNRAPVWSGTTSLGSYSNGSAQSIPLAAYASDPDADPLTFTRQGGTAPAGVTVNASTGVLTIPLGTAAGSYTVIVRASDASLYADRTFTVVVTSNTGSTFTVTGSGFGTKASLTPLFYRFFAPGEITNGAAITGYGYSGAQCYADTTDGFVSGYGSIKHETTLGAADSFPHLYPVLSGLAERQIFQTYYYQVARTVGSGNDSVNRQMKGPRYAYATEYSGSPRVYSSFWHPEAFGSFGYTILGYFNPAGAESGDADGGSGAAYMARWNPTGWNLVESWVDFGTVGSANGFHRIYSNGAQIGPILNSEAMALRTTSSHLVNYVSLFPGFDSFPTTSKFRFRFCEHVVDTTCARVVVGNASTWGACTRKQYMLPTAWSDTSVTASWRPLGFATSGQTVYGYVVNASGTVSAATPLVVP